MVNIHAAKTNLSALLEQCEQGKEVIIARAGKPIAQLVPYQAAIQSRQLGSLAGKIELACDFDDPVSEENWGL